MLLQHESRSTNRGTLDQLLGKKQARKRPSFISEISIALLGQPLFSVGVKLRDHPKMSYLGRPNWPPVWTQMGKPGAIILNGEIGVLTYVYIRHAPSSQCYLVIDYEKQTFTGTLLFDDQIFCARICNLLQENIGGSIKQIGDLDIP
jgi:hypothetical protein